MTPEEFAKRLRAGNQDGPVLEAVRSGMLDARSKPSVPIEIGRLTILAAPDVVSVYGMRVPLSPWGAQRVADEVGAILPSRKLSDAIWGAASVRAKPLPRSGEDNPLVWLEHSRDIDQEIGDASIDRTSLVAGVKKDIVVGPSLDGSRVAIYGWHNKDGKAIQPYSTIHGGEYVDYSHGVRLISRDALLDGARVDLRDVFKRPDLVDLVSDQGMFEPRFPNVGSALPPASCRDGSCALPVSSSTAVAAPPPERSRTLEMFIGIAGIAVGIWGILEARKRRSRR